MIEYVEKLEDLVNNGSPNVILPVFTYYKTDRLWNQWQSTSQESFSFEKVSRFLGYRHCLDSKSSYTQFIQWFKQMKFREKFKKNEEIGELKAVTNAVEKCLKKLLETDDYSNNQLYLDYDGDDVQVSFDNITSMPVRLLSDGYRNIIGIVADVAYRMTVLNPYLEEKAVEETPGIVVIDEIDLHCHPKWQRVIVNSLIEIFPKVQFIATTHSPFVIQSLRNALLVNLKNPNESYYKNKSIEDIAEEIMDIEIPQRSKRYLDMINTATKYYELLEAAKNANSKDIQVLEEKLDELMLPFSDDPAYQAFLKMKREVAFKGVKN